MSNFSRVFLAAGFAAFLPLAASQAQTRKPAPRPVARPAAPAPRPTPPATPRPAAPAPRTSAPAPRPAAPSRAAASSSAPFEVGTNAVNVGIGIGSRYGYGGLYSGGSSSVSPAISASFERGILALGPGVLGVGGIVGYQGASYDFGGGDKFKYTDIIVMLRGTFHYPVSPEFDAYGGLGLGVRRLSASFSGPITSIYNLNGSSSSTDITSGLFVGGRYFFTSNIGAFAELGYDQTYLKVGLTAKF